MRTPMEWIARIAEPEHPCDCCCARCKSGREAFLIEADIIAIQREALEHAACMACLIAENVAQDSPNTGELSESEMNKSDGAYQCEARIRLEMEKLK